MSGAADTEPGAPPTPRRVGSPALFLSGVAACLALAVLTYRAIYTSERDAIRRADAQRLEYFADTLGFALEKNEHLPLLIGLERDVTALLRRPDDPRRVEAVNAYLALVQAKAGVEAAYVLDRRGLTLASSNAATPTSYVGRNYGYRPYVREAVAGRPGRFYGVGVTTGDPGYFLSAPLREGGEVVGLVAVKVSLEGVEHGWRRSGELLALADANGVVFLSSVPAWKYTTLAPLGAEVAAGITEIRQYGARALPPLAAGTEIRLSEGVQTVFVDVSREDAAPPPGARPDGRSRAAALLRRGPTELLVQSRPSGPLGWRMVMLSDLRPARATALGAAAAAGFGAAFALSVALLLRLRRSRQRERQQANAALRRVQQELESRIATRTAELLSANEHLAQRVETLDRTERILRETQDSAVQAGKLAVLGQMAAGITHELNQPLAALTTLGDNAARLLELDRLEDARENLRRMSQLTQRMGGIVGQLKAFARKTPAARSPVAVADALAHALLLVEPQRRAARAEIELRQPEVPVRASADAVRLEQILVNLLRNAIEALDGAAVRTVVVSVSSGDGRVRIGVRDHGPGLPPEVRARLFEPFFTTKPAGIGLGLGLAISRTIAQGLGGELAAADAPGGGAEFVLSLEEA